MKKESYNTKTKDELETELKKLRTTVSSAVSKMSGGKNTKEYVVARKNIARVLTALNAQSSSTEAKI